ncbi:MAG: DUF1599 domain-containing protein [Paludibacter sp.]|nr:DUF1599 domain-containing protein [Bacteroidales bacterium]MCM1068364.1 DUF1599 domain-containing protein [Prevotella sp.]MCM1354008.1 DUF1599 domain-containing protein [Bacteroides sp.]MCM1442150.1 DUF1599 domain-containing protein [Muribaculum sp.]MCM1481957.1 DUF1599 domain-containing protein [Paludibacter sp.]
MTTSEQYDQIINTCRNIFIAKMSDYGPSWRIMRPQTVNDQLFIKAKRIREIETTGVNLVGENIEGEFIAIVNYSAIGIIQMKHTYADSVDMTAQDALSCYDAVITQAKTLMLNKNHDYGEAWRDMAQESITDLIYTKILRNKSIIANDNHTLVSEGADGNFFDMINYAVFNLIKIGSKTMGA